MTGRWRKVLRIAGASLAGILAMAIITAIVLVHTAWFPNYVREKIISETEEATGGKVEIGAISLQWSGLRAVATDFVIHGSEPAGTAPFLRIRRIEVAARLLPSFAHAVSLRYLGIDSLAANVMVLPDGRTNIPSPRRKSGSSETALETMVDLAVGRFDLTRGTFTFDDRKVRLNARGENLVAGLYFNPALKSYRGRLSVAPLEMVSDRNMPLDLQVVIPVTLGRDRVQIEGMRITAPHSNLQLNGSLTNLRDPRISTMVKGRVSLLDVPGGMHLPPDVFSIDASVTANKTDIVVNNARIAVGGSTLNAAGAVADAAGRGSLEFHANLALSDLAAFAKNARNRPYGSVRLDGNATMRADRFHANVMLRDLDAVEAARAFTTSRMPYDGVISGPLDVQANMKSPGSTGLLANAQLAITPGRHGIPVSGRLNASYDGSRDSIALAESWIALPHTRATLSGSTADGVRVAVVSRDLAELQMPSAIALGPAAALHLDAIVTGALKSPRIAAHLAMNRFHVEDRSFDALSADLNASPAEISVQNGTLRRASLDARFTARAGLRGWDPSPSEPFALNLSLRNGDLADAIALAGQKGAGYTGTLSAAAQIGGTLGNPRGTASLNAMDGTILGQPFDRIQAQVNLSDRLIAIPAAYIAAGPAHIDLEASYWHSRDSLAKGSFTAHVASDSISLAQVNALRKQSVGPASGTAQLNADIAGTVASAKGQTKVLLTSVNGGASARGLVFNGRDYGDADATARTTGNIVSYRLASNFAGSNISARGSTTLTGDYPTSARVAVSNLPIQRALAAAHQTDISAAGNLSGTAEAMGTLRDPQATADLTLTKATIRDQPLDAVRCRVSYTAQSVDLTSLDVTAGQSHVHLSAHYTHPRDHWKTGRLQFQIDPSGLQLASIHEIQQLRPGLTGVVQFSGNGDAQLEPTGGRTSVLLPSLNLDLAAKHTTYGDATLAAHTTGGRLSFTLSANFTGADIHGQGTAQLAGDYPVNAQLSFRNLSYTPADNPQFRAAMDGEASISGPAMRIDDMHGMLQLTRVQAEAKPGTGGPGTIIRNEGAVVVALERSVVTVRSAHLTGPSTDIGASGTIALNPGTLNLSVTANAGLNMLHSIDRDIYASGGTALAATVRGTFTQPLVSGRLELRNASLNYAAFPNGLSNANGVILFNGASATLQNVTAESGGGRITLTGFVSYAGAPRFSIKAMARDVRVRYSGASVTANATLNIGGSSNAGLISGNVVVRSFMFSPQSDLGSMLMRAAPPVQAPTAPSPLLANTKLDIRVRTSTTLMVQTSMARNIQADADLRVRGTLAEPGMLGRINVTEGQLMFFGGKYTVNQGAISFYDPRRIEPVLNFNLETQTQGVDVVITVSGPIDNMKLSYSSDPPLNFQQIAGLLAAGQTPTSDPTLVANQPINPPQSNEQMGESAIVGQAIANPVTSQLQRVFGISELKVDPAFYSGSDLPEARMTLQQQISKNLTFTYITDLSNPNDLLVRAEWAFDSKWSAVATRDEFGRFSIVFYYKRQFR